jgi:hypothetical protein
VKLGTGLVYINSWCMILFSLLDLLDNEMSFLDLLRSVKLGCWWDLYSFKAAAFVSV